MAQLTATHKGLITGSLMIIVSLLLFYGLHLPENGNSQFIVWSIYVGGVVWSLLDFNKKAMAGASFKDYFQEGFKAFIVVSLFMAVFTFVFYKLNPQILEETIKKNDILVQQQGDHTAAEIEENSNRLRDIFMPMMLATKTILNLLLGAITTVIGSMLLKGR